MNLAGLDHVIEGGLTDRVFSAQFFYGIKFFILDHIFKTSEIFLYICWPFLMFIAAIGIMDIKNRTTYQKEICQKVF